MGVGKGQNWLVCISPVCRFVASGLLYPAGLASRCNKRPHAAVQRERVDRKTRGLRQPNEIPTICYLFCCSECDFVLSFKVCGEKFDRSGYFLLGAYFRCILDALFGGIKVSEGVGWGLCRLNKFGMCEFYGGMQILVTPAKMKL